MPVTVARPPQIRQVLGLRERRLQRGVLHDRGRRLRIALVNNMPDNAVMSTQRQFIALLEESARDFDVTLGFLTLAKVERAPEARREMAQLYRMSADFDAASPDAIIVTGAEPRAAELENEPYWGELTNLFDVARRRSYATLASCLAAHAWVLHRDDVRRRRFARKWSGLYRTEIATRHPLAESLHPGPIPHSRWNGLDEAELVARGYVVLTRAGAAGVDMFARDDEHLALMFQGHPEYDGDTLAREFRRDVGRWAQGGAAAHMPENYYDEGTEARLAAELAQAKPFPDFAMQGPAPDWRKIGAVAVGNWLTAIAARKRAASGPTYLRARWGG